jgi:hypothetical protein
MTDYQDLINSTTRVDRQSLVDFLSFAEKLCTENKHEESTKVFRDPSIFYRIAVNTYTITEPDNSEAYQLNERCKLIKRWIKAHPTGISPLPRIIDGLTPWFIFCTVDYDILNERDTGGESWPLFPLIESALCGSSCVDDTPHVQTSGHGSPSAVTVQMEDYFGLRSDYSPKLLPVEAWIEKNQQAEQSLEYLNGLPLEVRIWVDLLADEIERQFHASKTKN